MTTITTSAHLVERAGFQVTKEAVNLLHRSLRVNSRQIIDVNRLPLFGPHYISQNLTLALSHDQINQAVHALSSHSQLLTPLFRSVFP